MNFQHQLLTEYKAHYESERDRVKRIQALQDETQARASQIIIDWIEFEIRDVEEEIDLYSANLKTCFPSQKI